MSFIDEMTQIELVLQLTKIVLFAIGGGYALVLLYKINKNIKRLLDGE